MPEYFKTSPKKNKRICTSFPNHEKKTNLFYFYTQYHIEKKLLHSDHILIPFYFYKIKSNPSYSPVTR